MLCVTIRMVKGVDRAIDVMIQLAQVGGTGQVQTRKSGSSRE